MSAAARQAARAQAARIKDDEPPVEVILLQPVRLRTPAGCLRKEPAPPGPVTLPPGEAAQLVLRREAVYAAEEP